jgi:uncharacterized RDD family membrane protein YckC
VVLRLTYPLLRPVYLTLGEASVLAGLFVAFLYVALAEGPAGKGQTVGKRVCGIRTTDADGEPLTGRAAAIRAALLLALALPFLGGYVNQHLIAGGERGTILLVKAVFEGCATAYIIANVFLVVLHPLKQTVHDLAARTIVVREAGSHNLAAFLEQNAEHIAPLQQRAFKIAGIAFIALAAVNVFGTYRQLSSDDFGESFRFLREFEEEFQYDDFQPKLQWATLGWLQVQLGLERPTTASATVKFDVPPVAGETPTVTTHTLVISFRTHTAIPPIDAATSDALRVLGTRAVAWAERRIREDLFPLDLEGRSRTPSSRSGGNEGDVKVFQPRYIALMLVERVDLLLFKDERVVWVDVFPLGISKQFYQNERKAARESLKSSAEAPR